MDFFDISNTLSSYNDTLTDAVKLPASSIIMGGRVLTQLNEWLIFLSVTDNRNLMPTSFPFRWTTLMGWLICRPVVLNFLFQSAGLTNP